MSNCNFRAPNGEPSLLYADLAAKLGPEKAEQFWYETKSSQFTDRFQDIQLDKNGEPTAEWVISALTHSTLSLPDAKPEQPTVTLTAEMFTTEGTSEDKISTRIKSLYDQATKNPDKLYLVPFKRNTPGIKQTGGPRLTMTRLSELFLNYPIPENVRFDPTFEGLMSATPTRILNDITITPPTLIPVDANILEQSKENNFLKVRDEYGQPTGGWFEYNQQQEAVDSMIYLIYSRFMKGITKVQDMRNAVEQVLKASLQRHLDIVRGKKFKGFEDVSKTVAEQRVENLQKLLNSFYIKGDPNNLWNFTLNKLKIYGLNIYGYEDTNDQYSGQPNLVNQNDGISLRDFRDSSFELDRKDTASSRIKLFLSSIEDSEDRRMIRMAFTSALVRDQILSGEKPTTIRSAEVADELGLKKGETAVTKIDGRLVKVMSLGSINESDLDVFADIAAQEGIDLKAGMVAYSLSPIKDESMLAVNKNYLGMPKLINFEDTFQKLMGLLSDQEPSLANYMTLLYQSPDPIVRRVAEKLDRESEQVKNEFVTVMSNQYQQFTVVMFGKQTGKDGITRIQSRAFAANYSSQVNVLLRNWEQNQKLAPIAHRDATGNITINRDMALSFAQRLTLINDSGTQDTAGVELFKDILSANGIELPAAFYDNFLKNADKITRGTRLQGNFNRQFSYNKDGTPAGIVSILVSRLNNQIEDDQESDNSFQVNNPMYTEGTTMNVLARAALQYLPMVYSNTHRSSEDKSIYDHGLNTSLSHKVRRLKTDEQYRKTQGQTYINEHNSLLVSLNNDPELRDRFQVTYMDGLKPEYKGATGTSRSAMSFREQLLYSLALFEKKGSKKYADYLSLTHSDKTTSPVFLNGPRISIVTGQRVAQGPDGPIRVQSITNEVYKAFWAVFLDEYNRVTKTADVSYNADQFDKGKKYFFNMPEFNLDNMKKLVKQGVITKEEFNALWTDLGAIKPIETAEAKQLLLKMFNRRIDTLWKRTHQSWINEGLLTKDQVPFSLRYMNRLLYAIGVISVETKPGTFAYKTLDEQEVSTEEAVKIAGVLAARDYAINTFLFNTSASRLLYGDPAEVYKKDISTTMVEYSKRLAKDIAPGKDGEWSHSPQYSSITVEDWEGPAPEVQELVLAYEEGVNATDAQELVTVQEYLDGKLAVGQISKQVYDEMSQIIKTSNGKYYEFTKPEHKIVMQPQKPVYVGEGNIQNGVILTHYIKSSAYPLLPAFTVGKQLDELRTAMEKNGIARLNFKSAAKLGRPGAKLQLFNKDGSMDMKALTSESLATVRQTLSRKGFRIQQEVPHDPDKRKIGIVTQMNKLIVQGIATIKEPFTYQGNQVTAQALMDLKSEVRKKVFDLHKEEILKKLGVKEGELQDFNKLYDEMLQEAATRPGYTINDLELLTYRDSDGKPLMPMIFSPSRTRFESLLMNKIGSMTEMKMYGRSFIQASSAGLQKLTTELTEAQKKQVVFAGTYRGGQLQTLRHEKGEVKPAQILVPFNFFAGGRKLSISQFITTDENGYQVIDPSKIPPEFLQLVGARIPNQGHSSMLPMEIVGFLPDEMGDTIVVPAAITKQMGSDFDVDKLYTYQRAYEYNKDGHLEYSDKYEEQLLNAYFDVHWSILMHPEMTKRILSPLDKPDLKQEAEKAEQGTEIDFFDTIHQLESFQSQKFAKQLVGFAALSLTNNAVFEPLNVTLGRKVFNQDTGETETVPFAIEMVDSNGRVHALSQFSGYGESVNHDIEGSPSRTKHDNLVILLSGFLDHAKEPVTPQINLNLYTYNAAAALLRLQSSDGVAAGIPELAALLRQPILVEYAQMMSAANDSLSETFEPDLYAAVTEQLAQKYMRLAGITESAKIAQIVLQDLRDDWTVKDVKSYYERQLSVLQLFNTLWKMGKQLADVQSAFNWDVSGPGGSILAALNRETAIDDTRATNEIPGGVIIQNLEDMYGTEQGHIRDQLMDSIQKIALQVFPYRHLTPILDGFKQITGNTFVSSKVEQLLIEGYLAYQWTEAPIWQKDDAIQADRIRLMYSGSHGPSLAKRVQDAKISWGRSNYLLQRIDSNISTGSGPDFITYSLGISSGFDAAEVARSWNNLLSSEDENQKRLGEDIVRYAILTGNSSTLARHIPISYLLGTSFLQATENLQQGEAVSEIFIQQFLQHYPQYAKTLSTDMKETGNTYEDYPESFRVLPINLEDEQHPGRKLWIRDSAGGFTYPEFLSYRDTTSNRWILYQQMSYLTYQRIDTLGNNSIDEYSPAVAESVIPENRAYRMEAKEKARQEGLRYEMPSRGNWSDISKVLSGIENNTTEPQLYRQLAGLLNTRGNNLEEGLLEAAFGKQAPEFSFEITSQVDWRRLAQMDSFNNHLQISDKIKAVDFSKTLIHELIHQGTSVTTTVMDVEDNLEYYRSKLSPDKLEELLRVSRQMKAQMPDVYQRVKALNDVRKQALEQLKREDPGLFNMVYDNAIKGEILFHTPAEQRMARMIYAMASNTEFLSHIFTDQDIMKWLNNRKANVEKSFWDQVVDTIASIMKAVAEFIGIGIEQGSLLEVGIQRAMDLMKMEQALPGITTKGIADINPDIFKNSSIATAPISASGARKLGVIIARLEDQRREIRQTFTGTITREQAARKRKLLDDLDDEIERLKGEQDLTLIAETGKKQLKWVTEIMARKGANANDIMVADRILELWTNLIPVMYGDNKNVERFDSEWSAIAAKAQEKRQELTALAIDRMIVESKGILSKRDFTPKELSDPNWISVRVRGLSSAAKSKALQYVSTYMEQAGRMVNEEVLRVLNETKQLEDDFIAYAGGRKNLPDVYQKLMQENKTGTAWGLVRRYSSAWYGFLTDTKEKREHRIDVINRDKSLSARQKSDFKRVAWQDFWKMMSSQAAMVDTRLFFTDTAENHPEFDKAFQDLVSEVGQDQATKSVEKARERYKIYLEEKETLTDMLEADVISGSKTRQEADKELQSWISRYSPNVFFNNFKNNFSVFNDNITDRFVIMVPKASHTKYFDKKFTELQQDPKLYELYNRLHTILMKMRSYLPKTLQYQLGENFLPVVARSLVSDISSVPEYLRGIPDRFVRSLTATAWEEANKGSERIPISYVDTKKQKDPAEIATRSRDLVKITELFAGMAVHYKHFAHAKDVIDMGQSIIREIDRTRMRDGKIVDEQGRVLSAPDGLKNALEALQYMKEYVMFKRAKALEGNTGLKIYSLNPKKQAQIAHRVKELTIEREKLNEQLLNGELDGDTWKEKVKVIDEELSKYDGKPVYGSKIGDKLISIQQAKALSFNPFSAVANFTFGVVSSAIFANGRQEFGNSEFRKAFRIMLKSSGKWASFGTVIPEDARKIMNVMDRLGVMGDVVESTYGKLENRQRVPNWKKTINPYNWLRSGDYFCRGLNMVATLLKQQVTVETAEGQKQISIWEALDGDGQWNETLYGKRPEFFSENVEEQTEWNKLRDKIARVNMIIMGNVDKVSPKMANKWIVGRLLGQFRLSWLPEGWYNRWAEEKYDIQLQRNTKGRYTTYKDMGIGGSLRILMKQYLSMVSKTDPFTGEHKMDGKPISTADVENMRRNFAELNFYLLIVAAILMLKSLSSDDDDDESQAMQILLNMVIRMKQDVAFYSSPEVFDTVTRNAVPAFGVVKDYTKLMDATWKIMTEDDYTADRWLLKLTKAGLPIPQATLINKIKYMSERDLDDLSR